MFGEGAIEAIVCGGPAGHVELLWDEPRVRRWFERLATFCRVAVYDRRGTGASDAGEPTLDGYIEDIIAVADACGFERPVLFGGSDGGPLLIATAARHPDRIDRITLNGVSPRGLAKTHPEIFDAVSRVIEEAWGRGDIVCAYAPSMADDERFRRWAARFERNSVSPRGAREVLAFNAQLDVTDLLGQVQAPALVIHRRDDTLVPFAEGEALAAALPNAVFVALEGSDNMGWVGDSEATLDAMEDFLTGSHRTRDADRALQTILFTDIVGSTRLAASMAAQEWSDRLGAHHRLVAAEVEREGGRVVKTIGDGVLATFDRPGAGIRAAAAALASVHPLDLKLRAGLHLGEVELLENDLGGLAVHIGARVCSLAGADEVLVSSTVHDVLIGSGIRFKRRGHETLRGVPGRWRLHALAG